MVYFATFIVTQCFKTILSLETVLRLKYSLSQDKAKTKKQVVKTKKRWCNFKASVIVRKFVL